MKSKLLLGLAFLGALLWVAGAVQASSASRSDAPPPNAVLDQSNPKRNPPCNVSGWLPDDSSSWAAQSFTSGITGSLTDVVLPLKGTNTGFTLTISPADQFGQPTIGAASALASVNVPFTPTNIPRVYPDLDIHFPTPPMLKAGSQYAIVLTAPNESPSNFIAWAYDAGSSETDSSGTPCADGAYPRGRAWGYGTEVPTPDADFFFSTYMVPSRHLVVQKAGNGNGTVTDAGGKLSCGTTCAADLDQDQAIQLTATPDARSVFGGWSGGCSGTNPTCSLTLTADSTVTATFAQKTFALTVRRTGAGTVTSSPMGISCGRTCRGVFVPGGIRLGAKPAAGWRFARWQGACRGTSRTCRLDLEADATAAAVFTRKPKSHHR